MLRGLERQVAMQREITVPQQHRKVRSPLLRHLACIIEGEMIIHVRIAQQRVRCPGRVDHRSEDAGEFDLTLKGWSADYDDPLSFADLFSSWNANNNGRYNNPAVDAQVRIAERSVDPAERLRAFAEVERILIEDAALLLAYERGVMYVQDPRLKNVARRMIGPPTDYARAYITEEP